MDSVHHIWCPLSSQEFQDLPDGAETTLTIILARAGYRGNQLNCCDRQVPERMPPCPASLR
ncbi:hypothetical protein GSA93_004590 [Salmonella enterica]|uniref:Uncharacterized protein n=1 Tax=Salmonella enterica subsp. enterica serovar Javiana TaxID=363569 RepID=A0A607KAQ9_SALET|nr:hypothetical protein [Salmonella enterica]EAR0120220.1 hypothetical protein [Salmonella enterica subsp. enterica serovar Javiana]EBF4799587.1 hypothetical protein [Salmonella enterica subsp. enterica]EDY0542911.1 hypothetical protein [Salmonella enterica subsp. enterica serovar Panama]EAN6964502.1 hypothetical protein [Salmonella enterica]